jgi:hypothetical protein
MKNKTMSFDLDSGIRRNSDNLQSPGKNAISPGNTQAVFGNISQAISRTAPRAFRKHESAGSMIVQEA